MVRSDHYSKALREIKTMTKFSHRNILPPRGIAKCPGKEHVCILNRVDSNSKLDDSKSKQSLIYQGFFLNAWSMEI